jgi:hypothetical protein
VPRQQVEEPFKINQKILAREVRLVGDNVEQGVYPTDQPVKWPRIKTSTSSRFPHGHAARLPRYRLLEI